MSTLAATRESFRPAPSAVVDVPWLRRLSLGWDALLNLGFGALCIHFVLTVAKASDWPATMLAATAFGIACWRPATGIFALMLGFALLNGLGVVLHFPVLALVASSLWLGMGMRKLFSSLDISSAEIALPVRTITGDRGVRILVNILATTTLLEAFWQLRTHSAAGIWGAGFPSGAFLWLQGFFFFRATQNGFAADLLAPAGVRLVCFVNLAVILVFFGVQGVTHFPPHLSTGFQSPFEDIGAFGAVSLCLLIFFCAQFEIGPWRRIWPDLLAIALLAGLVIASWSRGTWLAGGVALTLLAFVRLSRRLSLSILGALVGVVLLFNLNASRISETHPYAQRLLTLVRFEDPVAKNTDRIEIYFRAFGMIKERPWTGHGIGSFFKEGPRYARANDPHHGAHVLSHNFVLQLAAEQGVPIALLFLVTIGRIVWLGVRFCLRIRRSRRAMTAESGSRSDFLFGLGLTLMLVAYLQANLTWDLLLVYFSQPYFFWFMAAALLAAISRHPWTSELARARSSSDKARASSLTHKD